PEPLPQRQPHPLSPRTRHLAVHRAHRFQIGSRSSRLPRAGRPSARVDREGELSEDLVARYLPEGLAAVDARARPSCVPTTNRSENMATADIAAGMDAARKMSRVDQCAAMNIPPIAGPTMAPMRPTPSPAPTPVERI